MNSKISEQKIENPDSSTRPNRVPEKVRTKLKTFTVKDSKESLVGKVKDVYFDAKGELNFLVTGQTSGKARVFLLNIKLLNKVDYQQRVLFVNLTLEQIQLLPETKVKSENSSEIPVTADREISNSPSTHTSAIMSNTSGEDVQQYLDAGEEGRESDIVDGEVVRLLEERLVVNRSKRKVGEVIVRKEIETRMVEVPIHREKLIVEQVGDDPKILAEIDLSEGEITGIDASETNLDRGEPKVSAEFTSVAKASKMLNSIAAQPRHGCTKIRIELFLEDRQLQETYQTWIDDYSDK